MRLIPLLLMIKHVHSRHIAVFRRPFPLIWIRHAALIGPRMHNGTLSLRGDRISCVDAVLSTKGRPYHRRLIVA